MKREMNYYDILGVATDANQDAIKKAFRKKASAAHPDREDGSPELMQRLNAAYACLSDTVRRTTYDESGIDVDSELKSLDSKAHEVLASVFAETLNNGTQNPIEYIHMQLSAVVGKFRDNIRSSETMVSRLRSQRTRIRHKTAGGENIFHAVIDDRIEVCLKAQVLFRESQLVYEHAQVMLENYESDKIVADSMVMSFNFVGSLR